jgi:hypothetical protein
LLPFLNSSGIKNVEGFEFKIVFLNKVLKVFIRMIEGADKRAIPPVGNICIIIGLQLF